MASMRGVSIASLIGLVIFLFVLAAIGPDAISEVENANTTGWDASAIALWGILGTVIVAGFVVAVWKGTSGG